MDKWSDKALPWFAVGVFGHVSVGFLVGYISGASLEIEIGVGDLASILGNSAAILTAVVAIYAYGDWKRSIKYGHMLENAQNLKMIIIRLQGALHKYSGYYIRKKQSEEIDQILRQAHATVGSKQEHKPGQFSYVKAGSELDEIRKEIGDIKSDYRVTLELLKPALKKHSDMSGLALDDLRSFELAFYGHISNCMKDGDDFRRVNKEVVTRRIDEMLDRVDSLMR